MNKGQQLNHSNADKPTLTSFYRFIKLQTSKIRSCNSTNLTHSLYPFSCKHKTFQIHRNCT